MTRAEMKRLERLEARIEAQEHSLRAIKWEWADLVEKAGQSAVARQLGVSRQVIHSRLNSIRRRTP